ncbi:uncharacterized protein LOC122857889 isoform X2 [Aphidius gifuensis]|nr:uncharacterized protein LOC122857889 isoform X2 [Aphidius gifuensis]
MLDPSVLTDLEELTLCGYCKQKYNDNEQCPKYLSCKHYFCLSCIENNFTKGRELFCAHCWKRTELGDDGADGLPTYSPLLALANNFSYFKTNDNSKNMIKKTTIENERKSENCHVHGMPLALWCGTCCKALCRACATPQDHPGHQIKTQLDAKEQLISEVQLELSTMGKLSNEIQNLAIQQREFLIKILESCVTIKTHVENNLQNNWSNIPELSDARETLGKVKANLQLTNCPNDIVNLHSQLLNEKTHLQKKYHEMMLQCQLDDLICHSNILFNFDILKQSIDDINCGNNDNFITKLIQQSNIGLLNNQTTINPLLFLANYCISQLYANNNIINKKLSSSFIDNNNIQQELCQQSMNLLTQQLQTNNINISQKYIIPSSNSSSSLSSTNNNIIYQQQNSFLQQETSSSGSSSGNTTTSGLLSIHSPTQLINNTNNTNNNNINNIILRGPVNIYPMYYFNIDVNGGYYGRIVIEIRPDVAPNMTKNFSILTTGESGIGYKGCSIFQCWENESIITGDFELNNGRGGRSIFPDGYFMPDDTKFPAVRGAVGMRRTQKRHDNMGMVGSQFRIILQQMKGFTGIFGHVVEGLELVEKISTYGDQTGKPTKNILISQCGKL